MWVACTACGLRAGMHYHAPDRVYCDDCGRIVGTITPPIAPPDSRFGALHASRGVIVDSSTESNEVLARVEWDEDRVEIHEGDDSNE